MFQFDSTFFMALGQVPVPSGSTEAIQPTRLPFEKKNFTCQALG
jgi:hypothetical protein